MKLILNLILVPNPKFGVNGAAWASVACHVVSFSITMAALRRLIKLNLTFKKFVIKPAIAVTIMAICSYFIYTLFTGIIGEKMATIIAIITAIIIYVLAVLILKIFSKEEIEQIPGGNKICKILEKMKIY